MPLPNADDARPLVLAGGRVLTPTAREEDAAVAGPPVDVVCRGDRIEAIVEHRSGRTTGARVIDCHDLLLTPGYVNGHTHSHEALHRGRYRKEPLEVWMHHMRPPEPLDLDPDELYVRTAISAVATLLGGATTVVDDTFVHRFDDAHFAAVEAAYADVGLRARVGLNAFDEPFYASVPFVDEEMPAELRDRLGGQGAPPSAATLSAVRHVLGRTTPGAMRWIVTPSAPQRCSTPFLGELVSTARDAGVPVVMHVNETRLQAVTAQLRYGKTLTTYLDEHGLLGPDTSLVHGVWLTREDVERSSRAGASIQHNPVSNLRLGSGVAPVERYSRAGARITLGTDGLASCVSTSMAEAVKQTALLSTVRTRDPDRWIDAQTAFRWATVDGAQAVGHGGELGEISPGSLADVCAWRLAAHAFVPLNDALRQLVYADQTSLDTVIVGGSPVLRHGTPLGVDLPWLRQAATRVTDRHLARIEAHEAFVTDQLSPVFRRVYERAMDTPLRDVPMVEE